MKHQEDKVTTLLEFNLNVKLISNKLQSLWCLNKICEKTIRPSIGIFQRSLVMRHFHLCNRYRSVWVFRCLQIPPWPCWRMVGYHFRTYHFYWWNDGLLGFDEQFFVRHRNFYSRWVFRCNWLILDYATIYFLRDDVLSFVVGNRLLRRSNDHFFRYAF